MTKKAYITKTGKKQWKPVVTENKLWNDRDTGFCLACGAEVGGVEPDARKYVCPECDAPKVYGLEELVAMGLAIIKGGRGE